MFDVIIIGAGAMGSAAAYHLAKDKRRVLLLEQFSIGHTRASSHGESRIFRYAYPQLSYARLAMQCKPMWRELEADAGETLLRDTGGLDFADEPAAFAQVQEVAQALAAAGGAYDILDRAALARRFPQFTLGADAIGVYSPDAGVLNATRCVLAMSSRAAHHGAVVQDNEAVRDLIPRQNSVEVVTDAGRYTAAKVIVTAGAWVNTVLSRVGISLPVRVSQEQVVYFTPRHADGFMPGAFPIWIHHRAGGDHTYGFPIMGRPGAKIAFHHDGNFVDDISRYTATPSEAVTARLREYIRAHIPELDGAAFDPTACLYTTTPDENFIIGPAANAPNVIIGSPCSGHGFKFAIGIGRTLADLAIEG